MKKLITAVILTLILTTQSFALDVVRLGPEYFPDPTRSRAIANGYIYVGEPNLDPETPANQKQITVQQENGTLVQVPQPLRTNDGGVPTYLGSPVTLLVNGDYSLLIQSSSTAQKYYIPSAQIGVGELVLSLDKKYGCDLAAAVSDIGAITQTTLTVDCECIIDDGTTVTATDNISLNIPNGGSIDGVAGSGTETLNINGPIIAGIYTIFGDNINLGGTPRVDKYYPQWTGAKEGDSLDDTAAIQKLLTWAKGADATASGRSVFHIHMPLSGAGFYRIEDTLIIDGTYGLKITSDSALTERADGSDPEAGIIWYGSSSKPVFQIKGGTGTPSNPNNNIDLSGLSISGYQTLITSSDAVPATAALAGIYIGNIVGDDTENTLNRSISIKSPYIRNCRFGIYSGSPTGQNTDHAPVTITNPRLDNNFQAGIVWGTGNAICNLEKTYIANNGWGASSYAADDYIPQVGVNVYVAGGDMRISEYTSAGKDSDQPDDADIYQASGKVSVDQAWSDTHGYFFFQTGASYSSTISGVRHFEGSMDATNTPESIRIIYPAMTISSCEVYGNIVSASGLSGRPIYSGITFLRSGATFTGTGVQTQRSLIHIANKGNAAQIALGGRDSGQDLESIGNATPQILSMGAEHAGAYAILQALGAAGTDSGAGITFADAAGAFEFLLNCYLYDGSSNYRAHKSGTGYIIRMGGGHVFEVLAAEFADTSTSINRSAFITGPRWLSGGGSLGEEMAIAHPQRSADPTYSSGDFWEGSTYYNTSTNKLRVNTGGSTWVDLH